MKESLRFASLLASATDPFYRELARYLSAKAECSLEFVEGPWQERLAKLDQKNVDLVAMCGLLTLRKIQAGLPLAVCAAPIMQGARYGGQPIYFSDAVVAAASPIQTFEDLRGSAFAYNDLDSYSGLAAVRYHLHTLGQARGFFGKTVPCGSHQASLEAVASGRAHSAAIDSTVMDQLREQGAPVCDQARVIASLGPAAIPPLSIAPRVSASLRDDLLRHLLAVQESPEGRAMLAAARIERFVPARQAEYDELIRRAQVAEKVWLTDESAV